MTTESKHLDNIRERFTATADVFAQGVRTTRVEEAERLAERATAGLAAADTLLAIDVACGPGTYTRPLASRVRHAVGVDLTPAMIEKARAEAAHDGITNIEFVSADVYALPFDDGVAGVVSCGYAFHHMADPARALAEMARVLAARRPHCDQRYCGARRLRTWHDAEDSVERAYEIIRTPTRRASRISAR